jgi:hypothetical protein
MDGGRDVGLEERAIYLRSYYYKASLIAQSEVSFRFTTVLKQRLLNQDISRTSSFRHLSLFYPVGLAYLCDSFLIFGTGEPSFRHSDSIFFSTNNSGPTEGHAQPSSIRDPNDDQLKVETVQTLLPCPPRNPEKCQDDLKYFKKIIIIIQ